jgi:hypothetical protein
MPSSRRLLVAGAAAVAWWGLVIGTGTMVATAGPAQAAVSAVARPTGESGGSLPRANTVEGDSAATFTYTGGEQTYAIPAVATALVITAVESSFTIPKSAKKGTEIRCVVTASAAGYAPGTYNTPAVKVT